MVIIMSRSYLLVIGEAAALAWVLAEQNMAFPALADLRLRVWKSVTSCSSSPHESASIIQHAIPAG